MTTQPPQVAAPPPVVYVSFSAEINPNTTESLIAAMANCANQAVGEVQLLLSTPGGNVMCGMTQKRVHGHCSYYRCQGASIHRRTQGKPLCRSKYLRADRAFTLLALVDIDIELREKMRILIRWQSRLLGTAIALLAAAVIVGVAAGVTL